MLTNTEKVLLATFDAIDRSGEGNLEKFINLVQQSNIVKDVNVKEHYADIAKTFVQKVVNGNMKYEPLELVCDPLNPVRLKNPEEAITLETDMADEDDDSWEQYVDNDNDLLDDWYGSVNKEADYKRWPAV